MDEKTAILRELKENELYTLTLTTAHHYVSVTWDNVNLYLGMPNTIAAALAGASALSSFKNSNLVAGVLSILAAILAALLTFLNPSERAKSHREVKNEFERLYKKIKVFRLKALNLESTEEIEKQLTVFLEQIYDIRDRSPIIPDWAYKKGESLAKKWFLSEPNEEL